jgi:hypothetical protein
MTSALLHLALSAALATATTAANVTARGASTTVAVDSTRPAVVRTMVEIDNRNFNDATIYAVQGLRSVRLGTVTGLSTEKLVIPSDMVDSAMPIRFAVRPLASRRSMLSEQILVSQGDTVGLLVPPF